jgi:hypothetical protein
MDRNLPLSVISAVLPYSFAFLNDPTFLALVVPGVIAGVFFLIGKAIDVLVKLHLAKKKGSEGDE